MKRQDLTDALRIITVVVLAFIAIYLIKVNDELQGIRKEQVKNQLYTLSPEQLQQLNDPKFDRRKRLQENTVRVHGSVDVENY